MYGGFFAIFAPDPGYCDDAALNQVAHGNWQRLLAATWHH
jgi:hypothetical protein